MIFLVGNLRDLGEYFKAQVYNRKKKMTDYNFDYSYFENRNCKYYPCHKGEEHINCMFCYCPMYRLDNCPGSPIYKEKDGRVIKVCTECTFPHNKENYHIIMERLRKEI